jgi:hypothetical protein
MIISTKVSIEIDLNKVYQYCIPKSKMECNKSIRRYVSSILDLRATSDDGGHWTYPNEELIAEHLIVYELADPI